MILSLLTSIEIIVSQKIFLSMILSLLTSIHTPPLVCHLLFPTFLLTTNLIVKTSSLIMQLIGYILSLRHYKYLFNYCLHRPAPQFKIIFLYKLLSESLSWRVLRCDTTILGEMSSLVTFTLVLKASLKKDSTGYLQTENHILLLPAFFATWHTRDPVPPEIACINTLSPGFTLPVVCTR